MKVINHILNAIYTAVIYLAFRPKVFWEDAGMKNNLPRAIYVTNHMFHLDGFLMRTVLKKADPWVIITKKWYDKGWARRLMFYEKCIPIDRENPGTGWIHEARKVIKEGSSINIFPEGHTSRCAAMNEFEPGFLLLASFVKDVPMVPVVHEGNYNWFFGKRKRVLIGKPVYFDKDRFSMEPDKLNAYAAWFRAEMEAMQNTLRELK